MNAQVFISYAHADNQVFGEETMGWVSYFVDHLQKAMGMRSIGGQIECWMDHRLEPQRSVNDELRRLIQKSHCIVAFISPRYLESEWCMKEMDTFIKLVGDGKANDRVFLVELLPTEREHWHKGMHDLSVVKFWSKSIERPTPKLLGWPVPNTKTHEAYWDNINRLADILALQIKTIPSDNPPPKKDKEAPAWEARHDLHHHEPTASNDKVVWIADPTDDVLDHWETLTTRLKDHRILAAHYPYHEQALYQAALQNDLTQADCLVQLLGSLPGRKPTWANERLILLQANAAKNQANKRKLPFMLWRLPDIALEKISDADYLALLNQASKESFDAFIQKIIAQLDQNPIPPSDELSVIVNADKPDRDLGKQIQAMLEELEVDATLAAEPLPTQTPADYRNDLEAQLIDSHGVLIVYGSTPPIWVQTQYRWAKKVLSSSRKGIWGGLLDGPPPEGKLDHGLSKRHLEFLDCRQGITLEPLRQFVETLRQGAAHV